MTQTITAIIGLEEPGTASSRELSRVVIAEPFHPTTVLTVTVRVDEDGDAPEDATGETGSAPEPLSWRRTLELFPDY